MIMSIPQTPTSSAHFARFISGLTETDVPETGGSLEGLLNRSSLMDVPFRGESGVGCVVGNSWFRGEVTKVGSLILVRGS